MHFKVEFFVILVLLQLYSLSAEKKSGCKKLKNLEYELYGTKTDYETALKHLHAVPHNKKNVPDDFDEDTIAKEHQDLVSKQCVPIVFHFMGRHSARFPDAEDIDKYNKDLNDLKERLKDVELVKSCPGSFEQFLKWQAKMQNRQDNLITEIGARQERDIAKRYKKLYPEFFDAKRSNVSVGVTTRIRTAQTGAQFLSEVDNLNLPYCDAKSLPTNDVTRHDYNVDKVLNHQCYNKMMENYARPDLEFHKQCKKISGDEKQPTDVHVSRVRDPAVLKEIVHNIAEKLGLSRNQESLITNDVLKSIFSTCKFENVYLNDSAWCNLFDKKDIESLEYIDDVESYYKSVHGPTSNARQACPLLKDLLERFELGMNSKNTRQSNFYFSHEGALKKVLGALGVFADEDSYSDKRIREFVSERKIDMDREWRSSMILPFSGNIAFILYRCEKSGSPVKYKVLTAINEKPVKLGGCKETDCNGDKFFAVYNSMRDCDLNKICAKH